MSLINDALKRARDADRNRTATPPDLTLQPVDAPARGSAASRWLVLALVLVALGLSLWSFSRWARTAPPPDQLAHAPQTILPQPSAPDSNAIPQSDPLIAPVPEPASVRSASPQPPPATFIPTTEPPAAPPTNEVSPTGTDAEPPPPAEDLPELKLQSIIYRLRNPAVVINGQMLQKGDSIADALVLEIERHRVTLKRGESNLVLTLPNF
jgi:hypothetical protein